MAARVTYTPRISGDVYDSARDAMDDLIGLNATLMIVIRDIVAGRLALPTPPADLGVILDAQPTVRLQETVWISPETGEIDSRFVTKRAQATLVRDLLYALGEGRLVVTARAVVKEQEAHADHDA